MYELIHTSKFCFVIVRINQSRASAAEPGPLHCFFFLFCMIQSLILITVTGICPYLWPGSDGSMLKSLSYCRASNRLPFNGRRKAFLEFLFKCLYKSSVLVISAPVCTPFSSSEVIKWLSK